MTTGICALLVDGSLECWAALNQSPDCSMSSGKCVTPTAVPCIAPPPPSVPPTYLFSVGDDHACASLPSSSTTQCWGSNKQANAAHGADSPEAARREIRFVFGDGWSEAGVSPEEGPAE